MSRIVVTGTGVVSPLGRSRGALLDALLAGTSGLIAAPVAGRESFPVALVGAVPGFDAARECGRTKNLKYMSRASALAVAAARSAVADAGLALDDASGEEVACFVALGMTSSELGELEKLVAVSTDERGALSLALVGGRGIRATNPLISFKILSNMPLCHVALATRARGTNAALHSLGGETLGVLADAVWELREGRARVALWGAVDAQLERAGVLQLSQRGLLARGDAGRAGCPFDGGSQGRVLAEGAAFLVLEREDEARARGAKILGTIDAVGLATTTSVSLDSVASGPLESAIARTLAGVDSLAGVMSSAVGDPRGDAAEAEALVATVGSRAPVTSVRGLLGDTLAAGPAIDVVVALAALERGLAPACAPLGEPLAEARGLDLVRERARPLARGPWLVVAGGISATPAACLVGPGGLA